MIQNVKNHLRHLLIRSQEYTGTDNVYIAKQGFWSVFGYGTNSVLAFVVVVAFANLLPKEAYGIYRYILSVAGILSFLTLTGMNTALTQAVARDIKGLLAWSVKVQIRFNSLFTLASLIGASYYWLHDNQTIALGLIIIGITFPFSTALNSYGAYLAGKKDFETASHSGAISSIFSAAILFGALLLTDSIVILIAVYAAGSLLPSAYFYFKTIRRDIGYISEISERQRVFKYGAHLSVVPIIAILAQYLDKIILFQSTGSVQLATYALAQAMPGRINGLAKSISGIILPKLSTRSHADIRSVFYQRLIIGVLLGTFCFLGYWFISPTFFRILLPEYLESLNYSRILMSGLILSVPFNYIGAVFRSQKMLRAIYLSNIIARTPTVILYFVLGITGGIWGMVWASVGGLVITFVGTIFIWEIESRRLLSRQLP